jgi:hypothetical protein
MTVNVQGSAQQRRVRPLQKPLWPCQPHPIETILRIGKSTARAKPSRQETYNLNWRSCRKTRKCWNQTPLGLGEVGSEWKRLDQSGDTSRTERTFDALRRIV